MRTSAAATSASSGNFESSASVDERLGVCEVCRCLSGFEDNHERWGPGKVAPSVASTGETAMLSPGAVGPSLQSAQRTDGARNGDSQRRAYPSPGKPLRTAIDDIGWKSDCGATRRALTRVRLSHGGTTCGFPRWYSLAGKPCAVRHQVTAEMSVRAVPVRFEVNHVVVVRQSSLPNLALGFVATVRRWCSPCPMG